MKPTVYIMMFGWPVVSLVLFAMLRPRKAVLACLFAGWLLLPQAGFSLGGLPDYTRTVAILLGIFLGVFFFDTATLSQIRIERLDLPMVIFCLSPLVTSLTNGLGFYDGCANVLTTMINYGIPYFIGRLYFFDRDGLHDLAVALVLAVLCYAPLILYEFRMSPQLHRIIYGYCQIPFYEVYRLGGYRPMVFLHHGLELGVLVAGATLTAVWLWRSRAVTHFGFLSAGIVSLTLLIVCLLCHALNGYAVLIIGLLSLYMTKRFKTRAIVISLVLIPSLYITGRVILNWNAAPVVEAAESINQDRALSLQCRIDQEVRLINKALQRPFFGWGAWGRNRDYQNGGSLTDSFWIIVFGQRGLIGLLSIGLVLLMPIWLMVKRLPLEAWSDAEHSPVAALSMVLLGFTIDCLVNAMISPIYFVVAGSLIAYKPALASAEGAYKEEKHRHSTRFQPKNRASLSPVLQKAEGFRAKAPMAQP